MWLRRPPHPTLVLEKNINFSFFGGEGELVAGASLIRHSYSLWFALFVALFMLCCGCFFMVHVILSLPSFCPHLANCKKRAEGGQWQYHMNHAKMDAGGHKEGKKRAKKEGNKKRAKKEGKKRGQNFPIAKLSEKRIKIIWNMKMNQNIWKIEFSFPIKVFILTRTNVFNWNIRSQPYRKSESECSI